MVERENDMEDSDLGVLVRAGTPLIVLRTWDPLTHLNDVQQNGLDGCDVIMYCGVGRDGVTLYGSSDSVRPPKFTSVQEFFRGLEAAASAAASRSSRVAVYVTGLGHMLAGESNIAAVQMTLDILPMLKTTGVSLILIQTPGYSMSGYLSRYVTYCDLDLPGVESLRNLWNGFQQATNVPFVESVLQNLRGLTVWEAEQVLYTEYVRSGKTHVSSASVMRAKEHLINQTPGLRLVSEVPDVGDVKGLDNLKRFMLATAKDSRSLGVVMLGVQGTGKSMAAMAVASALQRPLVELNIGATMGSRVGQSESQMRQALDVVAAVRPCVLLLDEIEKMLSGTESSGKSDAGTTSRVASDLLKFLQNRPDGIYVAATCNDVSKIPPEYLRAERWDAIFFVDLPNLSERKEILDHYKSEYCVVDDSVSSAELEGWTGAEIKSLVRISAMTGDPLSVSKSYVVPISTTRAEEIQVLRDVWAPRCVPASSHDANSDRKLVIGRRK